MFIQTFYKKGFLITHFRVEQLLIEMSAVMCIIKKDKTISQTLLKIAQLNKQNVQNILRQKYDLQKDFRITYTDPDGDQIMVEFDQDYDVARMTHEDNSMITLHVNIENQGWFSQFQKRSLQKNEQVQAGYINIEDKYPRDLIQHETLENQNIKQMGTLQKQGIHGNNSQLKQEKLLDEEQLQNKLTEEQLQNKLTEEQLQNKLDDFSIEQPIKTQKKPAKMKKSQKSIKNKKTQTQSSNQQINEQLKSRQILEKQQDGQKNKDQTIENLIQQKSPFQNEQVKQIKVAKGTKKKEKAQKSVSKIQKNKKKYTQNQIRKLIKKQVFKLIPQISQRLGEINEQKNFGQSISMVKNSQRQKLQTKSPFICSKCENQLKVPFYINSQENIQLCQHCQGLDKSNYPLVKVRDNLVKQSLVWAQPLCQSCQNVTFLQQENSLKFYTQLKSLLVRNIRNNLDKRIKDEVQRKNNQKLYQNSNLIKESVESSD